MEPVEPAQMNIYQSDTYKKDLNWPHFSDKPRVQERQQVKDQQSDISFFLVGSFSNRDNIRTTIQYKTTPASLKMIFPQEQTHPFSHQ